jgi:hypothetical protein
MWENGILYQLDGLADRLDFPVGMKYRWTHKRTKATGERFVCVRKEEDGRALVDHWNRAGSFEYEAIGFFDRRKTF